MSKTWLVLKNEFLSAVMRRSFLLTLVLLPLMSFIILLVVSGIQKSSGDANTDALTDFFSPKVESSNLPEGFIDLSGIVKEVPPASQEKLLRYDNEEAAKKAVEAGTISAYYVIEKDYLAEGTVLYMRPDFNPLGGMENTGAIETLMANALTDGDIELAYRVQDPLNVKEVSLAATPQRSSSNMLTFFLPYIVTFLFYIVILTSSSLLLNNISTEKQNRMMEILMTSVTPRQMLTGKIIALGFVGLLQTIVWSGSGYLMLLFSGQQFALGDAFKLPPSILIWGIIYFILGYAVYASLMAGVGALVPNIREASQTTTIVILPLIIPLVFISSLIQAPNSPLSVVLSLFPLTAPVSMMTRLAATTVPFWQTALAAVLIGLTALFLVQSAAKMFRAQNLLSGQSINTKTFFSALFGK
ncbi:MAG: ABC transporter permease [Anaerolineaceae bacterium]|jgi:ABC-2 type transport system permease protein|nr:ABC transporter permease [Anaerolineaceae bacterium]